MRSVVALVSVLSVASAALAQDQAADWEVLREPEDNTTFAFVRMDSGLTVGFRCVDGVYGALIAGLPPARRGQDLRPLFIRLGDDQDRESRWTVTTDPTVALADYPAAFARALRQGGDLSVMIPRAAEGGRNLRHNLTLPPSAAAIDETLTACGQPLVDPRDAQLADVPADGLPDGLTWQRTPRPRYPNTSYNAGYAVMSCLVAPDGSLTECDVASEFPMDGGFGRNALRAIDDARVVSPNETPGQYLPRLIGFRVHYRR